MIMDGEQGAVDFPSCRRAATGPGEASHGVYGSARARFQRVAGWFLLRVRVLSAPLPFGCRCFRLVVAR